MKAAALGFAALAGLLSCGGTSVAPASRPATPAISLGYYAGDPDDYASHVNTLSADLFAVTTSGAVTGSLPAPVLAADQKAGIRTFACVSNYGTTDFDPALAHSALTANADTVIGNLAALATANGLAGINLDFEAVDPADRDAYSAFVQALAARLHGAGLQLILSVPAKTSDDPNDAWGWPYDYAAISQSADLLQLMTYDEHGPWGAPGAVAGLDWMGQCVAFALTQAPPSKLLIGLPAYGYDWNLTVKTGTSFTWKDIPGLIAQSGATPAWDAATASASLTYTASDGSAHVAWFETAQGLAAKAQLVAASHLAGLSVWKLGDEDAAFWSALSEH